MGPARIFSLSKSVSKRYFSLVQSREQYALRLRTDWSGLNGVPQNADVGQLPAGAAATSTPHHVVFAFDGQNEELVGYLNGEEVSRSMWPGGFGSWLNDAGTVAASRDMRIGLGNELDARTDGLHVRPWLGSLYHIAVYCRALTGEEVLQNFGAGY